MDKLANFIIIIINFDDTVTGFTIFFLDLVIQSSDALWCSNLTGRKKCKVNLKISEKHRETEIENTDIE